MKRVRVPRRSAPCKNKVRYLTEGAAQLALLKVQGRVDASRRLYRCDCNGWHLTSAKAARS